MLHYRRPGVHTPQKKSWIFSVKFDVARDGSLPHWRWTDLIVGDK